MSEQSRADNDRAVTWASEAARKRDMRWRRRLEMKHAAFMWWHGFYWKILHLTWLARPYSVTMCRIGLYRKSPDGRCMWCGEGHR